MSNPEKDNKVPKTADISHEEVSKPAVIGGDEALEVLGDHAEPISEEEAAAVLKKIDWRLMPVLILVNAIQLTDKNVSPRVCSSSPCPMLIL